MHTVTSEDNMKTEYAQTLSLLWSLISTALWNKTMNLTVKPLIQHPFSNLTPTHQEIQMYRNVSA